MLDKITYNLNQNAIFLTDMACIKSNTTYDSADTRMPKDISQKIDMLYNGIANESIVELGTDDEAIYDCSTVSCVFNIYCKDDTDVILHVQCFNYAYFLWVNKQYIGYSAQADVLQLPLKAGNNSFCFFCPNSVYRPKLAVRINKIENELNKTCCSLLVDNYSCILSKANILNIEYNWNQKAIYKGLMFSLDRVNIDTTQDIIVRVKDYYSDDIHATHVVKFDSVFEIDMSNVPCFNDDRLNFFMLQFEYAYKDETRKHLEVFFSFEPIETSKTKIRNEIAEIMNDPHLLSCTRKYLEFKLEELETTENNADNIGTVLLGDISEINNIRKGKLPRHEYIPRKNLIYYRSKLDNKDYHYEVYLPEDYDKTKHYPLIIHQAPREWSPIIRFLYERGYESNTIIVNATSRGVTLGSYVGEASMNEVLNDVKSRFLIDDARISAFGYSNGGITTWIHAQLAPHKFAAIAPSVGIFHPDLIKNLNNMRILHFDIPSDIEQWEKIQKHSDEFTALDGYSLIELEAYIHSAIQHVYVNKGVLDELSRHTINRYPDRVCFRAIHNRHLEAYWITIHSIEDTSKYGDIEASILSQDTIKVDCSHITGFTVNIPPQITSKTVYLIVNEQVLECDRNTNDRISVIYDASINMFYLGEPNRANFKIYHGTGLIDVYLKPISIINFSPESHEMTYSAQQFSAPQLNAYNSQVNVSYPICAPNTLNLSEFENRSLIVLDNNSTHEYAKQLRSRCEIQMDDEGFVYGDTRYDGDYCIMQILPHPNNPECSILYINANDPKLYAKNFFTRRVILPMYASGHHPYLNNAALILYKNQYHSVFEFGCDIQKL